MIPLKMSPDLTKATDKFHTILTEHEPSPSVNPATLPSSTPTRSRSKSLTTKPLRLVKRKHAVDKNDRKGTYDLVIGSPSEAKGKHHHRRTWSHVDREKMKGKWLEEFQDDHSVETTGGLWGTKSLVSLLRRDSEKPKYKLIPATSPDTLPLSPPSTPTSHSGTTNHTLSRHTDATIANTPSTTHSVAMSKVVNAVEEAELERNRKELEEANKLKGKGKNKLGKRRHDHQSENLQRPSTAPQPQGQHVVKSRIAGSTTKTSLSRRRPSESSSTSTPGDTSMTKDSSADSAIIACITRTNTATNATTLSPISVPGTPILRPKHHQKLPTRKRRNSLAHHPATSSNSRATRGQKKHVRWWLADDHNPECEEKKQKTSFRRHKARRKLHSSESSDADVDEDLKLTSVNGKRSVLKRKARTRIVTESSKRPTTTSASETTDDNDWTIPSNVPLRLRPSAPRSPPQLKLPQAQNHQSPRQSESRKSRIATISGSPLVLPVAGTPHGGSPNLANAAPKGPPKINLVTDVTSTKDESSPSNTAASSPRPRSHHVGSSVGRAARNSDSALALPPQYRWTHSPRTTSRPYVDRDVASITSSDRASMLSPSMTNPRHGDGTGCPSPASTAQTMMSVASGSSSSSRIAYFLTAISEELREDETDRQLKQLVSQAQILARKKQADDISANSLRQRSRGDSPVMDVRRTARPNSSPYPLTTLPASTSVGDLPSEKLGADDGRHFISRRSHSVKSSPPRSNIHVEHRGSRESHEQTLQRLEGSAPFRPRSQTISSTRPDLSSIRSARTRPAIPSPLGISTPPGVQLTLPDEDKVESLKKRRSLDTEHLGKVEDSVEYWRRKEESRRMELDSYLAEARSKRTRSDSTPDGPPRSAGFGAELNSIQEQHGKAEETHALRQVRPGQRRAMTHTVSAAEEIAEGVDESVTQPVSDTRSRSTSTLVQRKKSNRKARSASNGMLYEEAMAVLNFSGRSGTVPSAGSRFKPMPTLSSLSEGASRGASDDSDRSFDSGETIIPSRVEGATSPPQSITGDSPMTGSTRSQQFNFMLSPDHRCYLANPRAESWSALPLYTQSEAGFGTRRSVASSRVGGTRRRFGRRVGESASVAGDLFVERQKSDARHWSPAAWLHSERPIFRSRRSRDARSTFSAPLTSRHWASGSKENNTRGSQYSGDGDYMKRERNSLHRAASRLFYLLRGPFCTRSSRHKSTGVSIQSDDAIQARRQGQRHRNPRTWASPPFAERANSDQLPFRTPSRSRRRSSSAIIRPSSSAARRPFYGSKSPFGSARSVRSLPTGNKHSRRKIKQSELQQHFGNRSTEVVYHAYPSGSMSIGPGAAIGPSPFYPTYQPGIFHPTTNRQAQYHAHFPHAFRYYPQYQNSRQGGPTAGSVVSLPMSSAGSVSVAASAPGGLSAAPGSLPGAPAIQGPSDEAQARKWIRSYMQGQAYDGLVNERLQQQRQPQQRIFGDRLMRRPSMPSISAAAAHQPSSSRPIFNVRINKASDVKSGRGRRSSSPPRPTGRP